MLSALTHTQWAEKYRPQRLEDLALPATLKKQLIARRDQGNTVPLVFYGPSGTGKTTAARVMNPGNWLPINCALDTGVGMVERLEKDCSPVSLIEGPRVVVMDEADKLTAKAQDALRGVIERLSGHNLFVFTTNNYGKLSAALQSRVHACDFTHVFGNTEVAQQMHERALAILAVEGLQLDPVTVKTIIRESFPDMRKALNRLQAETMA